MKLSTITSFICFMITFGFAQETPPEVIDLSGTENETKITISSAPEQNRAYDAHYSHDLENWILIGQISVTEGSGELIWEFSKEQRTDKFFVRLTSEEGFSHILNLPTTPFNYANIPLPAHLLTIEAAA